MTTLHIKALFLAEKRFSIVKTAAIAEQGMVKEWDEPLEKSIYCDSFLCEDYRGKNDGIKLLLLTTDFSFIKTLLLQVVINFGINLMMMSQIIFHSMMDFKDSLTVSKILGVNNGRFMIDATVTQ